MAEVLHSDPVHVHKEHRRDGSAWYQTAVILVVLDPVQDAVACVRHEELANDEGVERPGENEGSRNNEEKAENSIGSV